MQRADTFLTSRSANAAVEFALIVPVMLLFLGGTVEFGRAYQAYAAVNRLAAGYASSWSDCSDTPVGTCATELALYTSSTTMRNIVPQLTAPIGLRMMQFTMPLVGSTVVPTYATPAGTTPTTAEFAIAQSAIAPGQTGVVVTVSYTHSLTLFGPLIGPYLGTTRAISYTVAQLK